MSTPAEEATSPISRVRIGVATHVAPPAALVGDEALQDLLLVIDDCIANRELKIIIDFAAVATIDSLAISALMERLTKRKLTGCATDACR